jgi:hypothetical protein
VWRQELADAHGEVTAGRTFDAREFDFDCAVVDNTGAIETVLDNIVDVFANAHLSGALTPVVFGYRPNVQYLCRIVDEIRFEPGLNGAEFTLKLLAPDPIGTPHTEDS